MLQTFGLLSGLLNIAAYVPYIRDTVRGNTKPHRTTWLIFSVMALSSFFSQVALGAQQSLWLVGTQSLAVLIIFMLSIRKGVGGLSTPDIFVLLASLIGLALWFLLGKPEYSLYANITVGFAALTPTIIKAAKAPKTETTLTWVLGTLAGFVALLATGSTRFEIIAYPIYVIFANGIVMAILLNPSRK